ncbi:MAG: polysaccharide/polyol phosphate ABC transporter ATP-binding protein [Candidatus Marinimicrobia bacterium]|nr:polysaccharide/polyol phosphate ABC transporter ATP-binding protein [Candidatus Neomarinimicrobiota bacterium]
MTELENVSLYLYSMNSKGLTIKRNLINYVKRIATNNIKTEEKKSNLDKDSSKILVLNKINGLIGKGDRIALIGSNGSGKSTLLKLLSGIYKPTLGNLSGDLFFPMISRGLNVSHDLSGYEATKAFYYQNLLKSKNIVLKEFIKEIENSCLIGKFFYQPICYYSEGMRTRLTFSLLTSIRLSDNLAIDEGFGTGDKDFANQAEKKLQQFLGTNGSLIFASHSDDLLRQFCSKGWVLKKGKILFNGDLEDALKFYNSDEY